MPTTREERTDNVGCADGRRDRADQKVAGETPCKQSGTTEVTFVSASFWDAEAFFYSFANCAFPLGEGVCEADG